MLDQFVKDWGYLAVAAGTFAEGETVLLAAGYASRAGWLELWRVIAVAVLAASAGDQTFYWIGRLWGGALLRRLPRLQAKLERVLLLLRRNPGGAVVAVRFLYGLRIAGPILIGAAGVTPARFAVFNVLGALLWAPLVAGLGWGFGHAWEHVSRRLAGFEFGLLLLLALVLLGSWLARLALRAWMRRALARRAGSARGDASGPPRRL
ncbi:MAG: DedA family protein [Betaproteobacteria bacterium]|nr:DedA family protein [Betaproteobacteria bacterium]MBU6511226.1 DedA family protein [Betaproteobacteria bacterium]MDE1955919.1 DedA family protein [Betaproteobacteria bacterium]MDE2151556.1 DedA family protein [Betaproteobacteria bacterium]MDE2478652.1 DedA family protein [Betaproteobacteria bacterium]